MGSQLADPAPNQGAGAKMGSESGWLAAAVLVIATGDSIHWAFINTDGTFITTKQYSIINSTTDFTGISCFCFVFPLVSFVSGSKPELHIAFSLREFLNFYKI